MNIIRNLQSDIKKFENNLQKHGNTIKPIKVMPNQTPVQGSGAVKPFMPTFQMPDVSEIVQQTKAVVDEDFIERPDTGYENAFSMYIENTAPTAKTVIIFPGLLIDSGSSALGRYGLGSAVILREGSLSSGEITVESDLAPLDVLQRYIIENPTILLRVQVASNSAVQNTTAFKVQHLTPWSKGDAKTLRPSDALDQYADNERYVVFPAGVVLSEQIALVYKLEPSTQTNLTFYFGPTLSKAKALARKMFKK